MKTKTAAPPRLHDTPPAASVIAGVARRDITPPVGIYARMWGAATHDASEGTHRPLSTTALALRKDKKSPPLLLITVDLALLGDLGGSEDGKRIMGPLWNELGLPREHVIINCTHTHSSPWTATSRSHMPGGDKLAPYLDRLGDAILQAAREAIATAAPATITWATGRCSLATNRDFPDPDRTKKRVVCGYNPAVKADDTVLVGRVTRDRGDAVLATVVNYACHPTTLAWLNRLISPDFVGSLRQVVEGHTGGAPCLFLQGASGEMAPAHQYVGDVAVPDKHGRQLGFAVLSALESMLPPRQRLTYQGVTESGAPLAVWLPEPFNPPNLVKADGFGVPLPLRKMPSPAELQAKADATHDRAMKERLFRKLRIVKAIGNGPTHTMPAWTWRIGQSLIIAHPNEAYSCFQQELRAAFPDFAVVVMNCAGPELGYLSPAKLYDQNIYQVWQSPFDRTGLSVLTRHCKAHAQRLTRNDTPRRAKTTKGSPRRG